MNQKGREISEGGDGKGKGKLLANTVQCAHPISVHLVANFFIYFTSYKLPV